MEDNQLKIARQSADNRLISSLLPGNKRLEVKERFRKMLVEGKLDERHLEISDSCGRTTTMTVKEVMGLLYEE